MLLGPTKILDKMESASGVGCFECSVHHFLSSDFFQSNPRSSLYASKRPHIISTGSTAKQGLGSIPRINPTATKCIRIFLSMLIFPFVSFLQYKPDSVS